MALKEITMSLQNSSSFNDIQIEHDNRKKDKNGKPYYSKNVDPMCSKDNWYYEKNISILEFYEKEFGAEYKAQQERNIKAGHPERNSFSSYYEEVLSKQLDAERQAEELRKKGMSRKDVKQQMSATTKVAYQTIIQLGDNQGDFRTLGNTAEQIELGKKLLIDFIKNWEKKYPEMKIINAAVHCDEVGRPDKKGNRPGGTVHAHITYCPVATTYKQGMRKRNSLTKALSENGLVNDIVKGEKFELAIEKWQQQMRNDFDNYIQQFGYKRMEPAETRTEHESIADYQKRQDQKKTAEELKISMGENQTLIEKQTTVIAEQKEQITAQKEEFEEQASEIEDIVLANGENYKTAERQATEIQEELKRGIISAIGKELPKQTTIPQFDEVEVVQVPDPKKKKKGLFGKEETVSAYILTPQQIELVKQYERCTAGNLYDKIDNIVQRATSQIKTQLRSFREEIAERFSNLSALVKLKKKNEELERDRQALVEKEVKKKVEKVLADNEQLKKTNSALVRQTESIMQKNKGLEEELSDYQNRYDGLETRARRLGFKLLADLVRHKEREQEDREDYDR